MSLTSTCHQNLCYFQWISSEPCFENWSRWIFQDSVRLIPRKRANKGFWKFIIQIFLRNFNFSVTLIQFFVKISIFWSSSRPISGKNLPDVSINRSEWIFRKSVRPWKLINKSSKFMNFGAGKVQKWTWKRIQIWFQLNVTLNMQIFTALVLTNTISWI